MRIMKYALPAVLFFSLSSCNLYKSEDRKDFESEATGFRLASLRTAGCAYGSVRTRARAAKLLTVMPQGTDSVLLWEYRMADGRSVFEADNLKGVYCRYENPR